MNAGRGYVPVRHRVKVLYSIELKPAELRTLWEHDHKRAPFTIRKACDYARRAMEELGSVEVLRRAGVE